MERWLRAAWDSGDGAMEAGAAWIQAVEGVGVPFSAKTKWRRLQAKQARQQGDAAGRRASWTSAARRKTRRGRARARAPEDGAAAELVAEGWHGSPWWLETRQGEEHGLRVARRSSDGRRTQEAGKHEKNDVRAREAMA